VPLEIDQESSGWDKAINRPDGGRVVVGPVLAWCNFGLLPYQREDAVQFAGTVADSQSRNAWSECSGNLTEHGCKPISVLCKNNLAVLSESTSKGENADFLPLEQKCLQKA